MTPEETAGLLAVLKAVWPDSPTPDAKAQTMAYHLALDDVACEAAMDAARTWIRTEKWFPRPAELRASAIDRMLPMPSAEEAWGEVVNQMHLTGMYGTPSFSCDAIWWAVRALDWREICCTERGDVPSLRAHFYRTYESYRQRAIRDADVEALGAAAYEGLAAKRRFEDAHEPLGEGDDDDSAGEDDD